MDPEATLQRLLQHIRDRDTDAACETLAELCVWLDKGGFVPRRIEQAIDIFRHRGTQDGD
jgi:hypothetical protein